MCFQSSLCQHCCQLRHPRLSRYHVHAGLVVLKRSGLDADVSVVEFILAPGEVLPEGLDRELSDDDGPNRVPRKLVFEEN